MVTDVGSTKRSVVAAHDDPRFVGGHPLAGAETAGVEHARADLFEGATWYLTPTSRTSGLLYERLYRLLHGLGARPAAIDPETHDTILATVSHLPHVLANVLVSQAARTLAEGGERLPATGPSFRDATRVAGAPSAIWTDIYLSNRDALSARIDDTIARLSDVRDALASGDAERITSWNEAASADRRRLLEAQLAGGPLFELRASVPNRPGVIAELALELGRGGRQHHRHGSVPGRRHERGCGRAVDRRRRGGQAHRGAGVEARIPGGAGMNVRFEPSGPVAREAPRRGRQVGLAPRRDRRRDGLRAGARQRLPRRRRHELDARRVARAGRDRRGARGRAR